MYSMTAILLGASLPVRSSHLPADLREQRQCPPTWCCSGWRLPRFTRLPLTASDSSLWPCSSPSSAALPAFYGVGALPSILLCGARTFPPRRSFHGDGGDGLAGFGPLVYSDLARGTHRSPALAQYTWPAITTSPWDHYKCRPISTSRNKQSYCPSWRSRRGSACHT